MRWLRREVLKEAKIRVLRCQHSKIIARTDQTSCPTSNKHEIFSLSLVKKPGCAGPIQMRLRHLTTLASTGDNARARVASRDSP